MWFAASVLTVIHRNDQPDGPFLVNESVVLIEATSAGDALPKARAIGMAAASAETGLTLDDKPAVKSFAGIRKLTNISQSLPLGQEQGPLPSGIEISRSLFDIDDAATLEELVDGKEVRLAYRE